VDIVILDRCMGRAGAGSAQDVDSVSIVLVDVVVFNCRPIGAIVLDDDPTWGEDPHVGMAVLVDLVVVDVGICCPVRHDDPVAIVVVDLAVFDLVWVTPEMVIAP